MQLGFQSPKVAAKRQLLNLDPPRNIPHKSPLAIFAILAKPERAFAFECTKYGQQALCKQDIVLGKAKGVLLSSMYDVGGG
ncbi:hypothetical protein J4E00_28125 [Siccationidurans soli]|uniref:Uncharacterized protein n=1 Tax=Hymenobacter negativus TaxID=2795026 RepID=A0ABS3QP36_9BACT|nr:hypothetical protein [Hymenobacter negativus]